MSEKTPAELACLGYEKWASEVRRATYEIHDQECPDYNEGCEADGWAASPSCFHAYLEKAGLEHARQRDLPLDEIKEAVSECASCGKLVGLIRERNYARNEFKNAKRRVNSVGLALATKDQS